MSYFLETQREELNRVLLDDFAFQYFSRIDLEFLYFLNNESFSLIVHDNSFLILLDASDMTNDIDSLFGPLQYDWAKYVKNI